MPIARNTFKLRIMDEHSDKTFYIAKKDKDGNYRNLKDALNLIYPERVSYDKTLNAERKEVEYVYSMDSKISSLNISKNYADFDSEDLNSGYWIKVISENGNRYKGDFNEPIKPTDIEITLMYIKGKDLVPRRKGKASLVFHKEFELLNSSCEAIDFHPMDGDSLVLELSPLAEQFHTAISPKQLFLLDCHSDGRNYPKRIPIMGKYQTTNSNFSTRFLITDYFGIGLTLKHATYHFDDFMLVSKNLKDNIYVYSKIIPKRDLAFRDTISIWYNQNNLASTPVTVYEGFVGPAMSIRDYQALYQPATYPRLSHTYDDYIAVLNSSGLQPKIVYPKVQTRALFKVYRFNAE